MCCEKVFCSCISDAYSMQATGFAEAMPAYEIAGKMAQIISEISEIEYSTGNSGGEGCLDSVMWMDSRAEGPCFLEIYETEEAAGAADGDESLIVQKEEYILRLHGSLDKEAVSEYQEAISALLKEDAEDADYILNTNTRKFHLPSCSSVEDMKEKNKQAFSGEREEVIEQGYVPCKRCNP